jgi:hypothetical protein
MSQLSLLPTVPPGDALADQAGFAPAQSALNATARTSDAPLTLLGAPEEMLAPLPEAL